MKKLIFYIFTTALFTPSFANDNTYDSELGAFSDYKNENVTPNYSNQNNKSTVNKKNINLGLSASIHSSSLYLDYRFNNLLLGYNYNLFGEIKGSGVYIRGYYDFNIIKNISNWISNKKITNGDSYIELKAYPKDLYLNMGERYNLQNNLTLDFSIGYQLISEYIKKHKKPSESNIFNRINTGISLGYSL